MAEPWYRDQTTFQRKLDECRSYAALSRSTGVPQSTLKTAASELGVKPPARRLTVVPDPLNEPLIRLADTASRKRKSPSAKRKSGSTMERIFFWPDVHIPYHDKRAFSLALETMRAFKPDVVVTMGDFVDFFAVSKYSKDPRRAFGLPEEIEQANQHLDQIEKASPGARRIYLDGNHENRLQRYLQDKAPELFAFIDVAKLLRLEERGWEHVEYKESTRIGKLNLTHDVGSAGRYNVYRVLDTFQAPVVTVHTHRMGYVVEGDATGGSQVSAQFGWLGDVAQIDYMHRVSARRNWVLGFGVGYHDVETGFVYLVPVPIVEHTAVVEGVLYRAEAVEEVAA